MSRPQTYNTKSAPQVKKYIRKSDRPVCDKCGARKNPLRNNLSGAGSIVWRCPDCEEIVKGCKARRCNKCNNLFVSVSPINRFCNPCKQKWEQYAFNDVNE